MAKSTTVAEKKNEVKKAGEYQLTITVNEQKHEMTTDDISSAILSVAPQFIKTKVIITVTKGGKTLERVIHMPQSKRLFQNKYTREAFINNLVF